MIYKLIVNAAFLAIGYYIGKEVAFNESSRKQPGKASSTSAGTAARKTDRDQKSRAQEN
jgi:hypothetical protein